MVKVHGSCEPNTFHGTMDGYTYDFLETSDCGHMLFLIKNPEGFNRVIEVDANGAAEMRRNPRQFWINYIH